MTKGGFKMEINITTPISREKAKSLKAGDIGVVILISILKPPLVI